MPRQIGWVDARRYPWEIGESPPSFSVYAYSETEKVLFGCLSGPEGRPAHQEQQIEALVAHFEASDDPAASFRQWVQVMGCDATDA